MSSHVLTQDVLNIALNFYEALDTPVSLGLYIQLKHGEYVSIMERKVSHHEYLSFETYLKDASAISFLKKLEVKIPGINPSDKALSTWLECEKTCYLTNRKLTDSFDEVSFYGLPHQASIQPFVERARKWVQWLIGDSPKSPYGRVGPGATLSDKFGETDVANKFTTPPTLYSHSLGLLPVFNDAWSRSISERNIEIKSVRGNKYFSVPKTAMTDRPCAKESSLNMYFQLSLGQQLRRLLLYRNIDLSVSQDLHKVLAKIGSIDDLTATIDLSSASDTVSHHLVKLLLPEKWYMALDQARAHRTLLKGRWYELEKFSSMGNGFTFELETVIFFALACCVSPGLTPGVNVHVYGDDIIVPKTSVKDVIAVLSYFGLTTNLDKTFVQGEFRESCGGDFWLGHDVRPIYLKEPPNAPEQIIVLHNKLIRHLGRFTDPCVRGKLRDIAHNLRLSLPIHIRQCVGPEGLGDLVLHGPEELWRYKWVNSIRYLRVYAPLPTLGKYFYHFPIPSQYAAILYGVTLNTDRVIGTGVGGYAVAWRPWS